MGAIEAKGTTRDPTKSTILGSQGLSETEQATREPSWDLSRHSACMHVCSVV